MSREFNFDYNTDFAIAAGSSDFNNDFNLDFAGGFVPGEIEVAISEYVVVPPIFSIVVTAEYRTITIQPEGV